MNNNITALDFLTLMQDCVNALILSGADMDTAVDTVNGVVEMYEDEVNEMNFGNAAEIMAVMFLGRRYEDSLG